MVPLHQLCSRIHVMRCLPLCFFFSQPSHGSEDNLPLAIKCNDAVDCEAAGVCMLSLVVFVSFAVTMCVYNTVCTCSSRIY